MDRLGDGKRKWFIIYYTNEFGKDKHGNNLPSASKVYGLDQQYHIIQKYDDDGEELDPELGQEYDVLTTPFTRDVLEKVCAGRDVDNIQFSIATLSDKSYGSFTYEESLEFGQSNFRELLERATLGRAGSDTSILFSELSTKEKLFLQQNQPKK